MVPESSAPREWAADHMDRSKTYLRVYRLLIDTAEMRGLVHYRDIANLMGLPPQGNYTGKMTGIMLGEIVEREHSLGRPMLSAVVVSSTDDRPGAGFYTLAEQFGLISQDVSTDERREFWERERNRVYEEWAE